MLCVCYTAKWISFTSTHIHSFSDSFPMEVIAECWVEFFVLYSRSLYNPTNLLSTFPQWVPFSMFRRKMCRKDVGSHCLRKYCPQECDNCSHSCFCWDVNGGIRRRSGGVSRSFCFWRGCNIRMGDRLDNSIALQMKGPLSSPNTVVTWDSAAHSREDLFLKTVHLMQHFEKSSKTIAV